MSDRRLRILLTVHQFFPRHIHGTERYTLDLAKSLQDLGHSVVVLTRSQHLEDCEGRDWNEYFYDGIRVLAVDLVTHFESGFESSFDRADLNGIYGEILFRERPDIIHCCHMLYLGANFISVAARARVPIFVTLTDFFGICWTNRLQTIHGKICKGPDADDLNCIQDVLRTVNRPFNNLLYDTFYRCFVRTRWGVRLLRKTVAVGWVRSEAIRSPLLGMDKRRRCVTGHYLQASDFLVATSYLMRAYVNAGYPADRMRLMHFGIAQPTKEEIEELRRRYVSLGETDRPFVIGFIGQIAKHKGLLDLLEAFNRSGPRNGRLHLYGDLKQDPKFTKVVERIAAPNPLVSFTGTFPASQIYSIMAQIDVLVIPSTWAENSPLVLLNALASRTMVVVSNVEGMSDLVREGINGRLVAANDPVNLATVLKSLEAERNCLLEWFDKPIKSYSTSPMDYATKVAQLYDERIASMPAKRELRRNDFPPSAPRVITVTCSRLRGVVPALAASSSNGYRLLPHELVFEDASPIVRLRAYSVTAHVIFDCDRPWNARRKIELFVKWPRDGLSVIYFGTAGSPEFCEKQKVVTLVQAGIWCRLSIHINDQLDKITRLRWDPLYDAKGLTIELGWPLDDEHLVQ